MLDNQIIKFLIGQLRTGLRGYGSVQIATESGLSITTESGEFLSFNVDIGVQQSYQPRQQGINKLPTVYLHKLFDERIGCVGRATKWVGSEISAESGEIITSENDQPIITDGGLIGTMQHTETQQYATHFQLSAVIDQNPVVLDGLTASDILNRAAAVLQSSGFIEAAQTNELGIFRIGQIRNPYFEDDRDRFEAMPSFDFAMTHKQVIVTEAPVLVTEQFQILRV